MSELIKIKEDAIKIQERDLEDTVKSIENENTKSSFVLGFVGIIIGIFFNSSIILPFNLLIFISTLILCTVSCALFNIWAKASKIHNNVDSIFVNNEPREFEKYLNYKHLRLRESYNEAKKLLYKKALFTKLSYILLVLALLSIFIYKIYSYV